MVKLLIGPVLSLLIVAAFAAPVRSQSFFTDTNSTRLERIGSVIGASAAFSLADYIGYNLLKQHYAGDRPYPAPPLYRAAMALLQTAISYILYRQCGLSSAI